MVFVFISLSDFILLLPISQSLKHGRETFFTLALDQQLFHVAQRLFQALGD